MNECLYCKKSKYTKKSGGRPPNHFYSNLCRIFVEPNMSEHKCQTGNPNCKFNMIKYFHFEGSVDILHRTLQYSLHKIYLEIDSKEKRTILVTAIILYLYCAEDFSQKFVHPLIHNFLKPFSVDLMGTKFFLEIFN